MSVFPRDRSGHHQPLPPPFPLPRQRLPFLAAVGSVIYIYTSIIVYMYKPSFAGSKRSWHKPVHASVVPLFFSFPPVPLWSVFPYRNAPPVLHVFYPLQKRQPRLDFIFIFFPFPALLSSVDVRSVGSRELPRCERRLGSHGKQKRAYPVAGRGEPRRRGPGVRGSGGGGGGGGSGGVGGRCINNK